MSSNSKSDPDFFDNFAYQDIQNQVSEDEIPNLTEEITTSDVQRHDINFSDQNKTGFQTKKKTNTTKKTFKSSENQEQKASDLKKKKKEKIKSIQNKRSNPISFVVKLLFFISLLILIGGIFFAKLQEKFNRPPQTEDSRRDGKAVNYNLYRQNSRVQNFKNPPRADQKDGLKEEIPQNQKTFQEKSKIILIKQKDSYPMNMAQKNTEKTLQKIQVQSKTTQNQKDEMKKIPQKQEKIVESKLQQINKNSQTNQNFEVSPKEQIQNPLILQNQPQGTLNHETPLKQSTELKQNQIELGPIADTINWKKPKIEKNIDEALIQTNPKPEPVQDPIMMMSCPDYIQSLQQKYGRLYTFNTQRQYFRSNSGADYFAENFAIKINNVKYTEAVDLLDIVHKIDSKGQISVQNTPCESSEASVKRINQTIQKQFNRMNELYQIDFYHQHQLRFCIVSNSFKNAENGLLYRNIDSILQQNYTNYHVVYTDDASPDRTGEIVKSYLKEKGVEDGRFKVKINAEKKGMMENIFNAITQDCELGEIAVMLDGDDSFIGTNVLSLLNAVYQKEKMALIWNNFLEITDNNRAIMGFSRDYIKEQQTISKQRAIKFVSSHLKSFYVDLFRKIKVEDLQENTGAFYGGASDTAMMIPMIQMSQRKYMYLPEITYEYRYDTGQVGMVMNRVPQRIALSKLAISKPYQPLTDFSFIDDAIQKTQKA